jgi:formylglycine-generating enzyme required for sulfatase activity
MQTSRLITTIVCALVASSAILRADVFNMPPGLTSLETVAVGNPGNAPGLTELGHRLCGAVNYVYSIGKFEVTAGQYTAFLNAVAATDTYGLYNTRMASLPQGCQILRSGSPGTYTYSVAADYANRPVNCVFWGSTVRFANWLHNGQPTGPQGLATTEDGAYFINGTTNAVRKPTATWVLPSENEWFKAAYHKNDGVTGNYWNYPTSSDVKPDNGNPAGDTGNSANYDDGDYTLGAPYYRTEAGYFTESASPYGTQDQGGNVTEWHETVFDSPHLMRGGAFLFGNRLDADSGSVAYIPTLDFTFGFRVAYVPEPATMALVALGGLLVTVRSRMRR